MEEDEDEDAMPANACYWYHHPRLEGPSRFFQLQNGSTGAADAQENIQRHRDSALLQVVQGQMIETLPIRILNSALGARRCSMSMKPTGRGRRPLPALRDRSHFCVSVFVYKALVLSFDCWVAVSSSIFASPSPCIAIGLRRL